MEGAKGANVPWHKILRGTNFCTPKNSGQLQPTTVENAGVLFGGGALLALAHLPQFQLKLGKRCIEAMPGGVPENPCVPIHFPAQGADGSDWHACCCGLDKLPKREVRHPCSLPGLGSKWEGLVLVAFAAVAHTESPELWQ